MEKTKPRVLVDKTIDLQTSIILSTHAEVEVTDTTKLSEELQEAEILCIRTNTQINEEYLEHAKKLKIIATATTGTNHIDKQAVNKRGIKIIDAAGANADSVADYVFRMLFHAIDDVHYANEELKNNPEKFTQIKKSNNRCELASLSIGIIGFGAIGTRVARRAEAFSMKYYAYDPYVEDAKNTLKEVLECDIVTVHAELTDETKNMLNEEKLALLKKDAILINAARSEIIDEDELIKILKKNKDMKLIADVFQSEPEPSKLYELPNTTITPHIAGNAKEAKIRAANMIANKIINALKEREIIIPIIR
jgi:phosphoglycerate dehydrogenase-like enzyme